MFGLKARLLAGFLFLTAIAAAQATLEHIRKQPRSAAATR